MTGCIYMFSTFDDVCINTLKMAMYVISFSHECVGIILLYYFILTVSL